MPGRSALESIVERAADWPEDARQELAKIVREIEAELAGGDYQATDAELSGIDRGLGDAADGKFASHGDVEAVFHKHRRQ